jgi:hypothetical protein
MGICFLYFKTWTAATQAKRLLLSRVWWVENSYPSGSQNVTLFGVRVFPDEIS